MTEFSEDFDAISRQPEGVERTAALASWFQRLYEGAGEPPPVLVGGAAVELYTGGAYTTGDLDFVGSLPDPVAEKLRRAGFRRQGRHWLHREGQIFIELPGSALGDREMAVRLRHGESEVVVVDVEALLVDRLAAWEFWGSGVDGVTALQLLSIQGENIDEERLEELADARELSSALAGARQFLTAEPDANEEEMATWASHRE